MSSFSIKSIKIILSQSQSWRQKDLVILYLINNHELMAFNVPSIKFSAQIKRKVSQTHLSRWVGKAEGVERAPQS